VTTKSKAIVGVVFVLFLLVIGFIFFRGPLPEVSLPAEKLGTISGFSITNTILATWLSMAVLLVVSILATRNMQMVPKGVQNLVEAMLEALLNFVEGVAGEKNGRKFFPLVATIFLFVIVSAWLALFPGFSTIGLVEGGEHAKLTFQETEVAGVPIGILPPGAQAEEEGAEAHPAEPGTIKGMLVPILRSANTDLNTPLAIALIAVFFVEYWGITSQGFFKYGSKFINIRQLVRGNVVMGLVDVFVGLMELVSEIARIISFTFRLFGNMMAGEVLLAVISFLVPWVAAIPFLGLELFVGFVQALVFGGLTLVFATMAVTSHDEHEEGHEAAH